MKESSIENKLLFEITPRRKAFELNLKEIWRFQDLLFLFVRRDIVVIYKQTILGPVWFFIQPIMTSAIQFIIFGKIADIPSDGLPYFLFVLAENTLWNYFSLSFSNHIKHYCYLWYIFYIVLLRCYFAKWPRLLALITVSNITNRKAFYQLQRLVGTPTAG